MNPKQLAAARAVEYIKDGMIVGLGTGSTAFWAIEYTAEKVAAGLRITVVATSKDTETKARERGITITPFDEVPYVDIDIDGADEADESLSLIKGGGGALMREKIVANASRQFIVIADESKLVKQLGKFPLPVEVVVFGWEHTDRALQQLGCTTRRRLTDDGVPFVTDNGNYILDCSFGVITDAPALEKNINSITGVVDNGLFIHMAERLIIGCTDGSVREITRKT